MKTFKCDICKLSVGEYELTSLYERYQTDGIEHVCKDCNKSIVETIARIDKAIELIRTNWIKRVIVKLREGL